VARHAVASVLLAQSYTAENRPLRAGTSSALNFCEPL
jgi:hypothetical protein